jgi:hypothetical protein
MLIVYRIADGVIVDNQGTCSAWPEGPPMPDELVDPPAPVRGDDEEDDAWQARLDGHADELAALADERDRRGELLERLLTANLPDGLDVGDVAHVCIPDDSDLAAQLLTHAAHVDVDTGEVIVGAELPPPPEPGPSSRDLALADVAAAADADDLGEKVGHLTSALERLLA